MSVSIKITKANTRIYRSWPPVRRAAMTKHARHIGEIVCAWNELHSALFSIFGTMIGKDRHRMAHQIWHSFQSDKAQRELLMNAALGYCAKQSEIYENLKWVTDRAGDLSVYRNDATHTPMWVARVWDRHTVFPNFFAARDTAFARLQSSPVEKVWRAVRGDLIALTQYAGLIHIQMISPEAMPRTFPKRPLLQVAPAKSQKSSQASRSPNKSKRPRPASGAR